MEKLETVAAYVNEHKRHQENQSMVMEIANQFVGVPVRSEQRGAAESQR